MHDKIFVFKIPFFINLQIMFTLYILSEVINSFFFFFLCFLSKLVNNLANTREGEQFNCSKHKKQKVKRV